jgi:tRNA A37 threonylcarbamoyladenosine modification protein TsaB
MAHSQTALILDGSLSGGCVALLTLNGPAAGSLRIAEEGVPKRSHLERISALLPGDAARAGLSAIVIGVGPGSYTGIRAASAAAAGVATALGLPIISIPSDRALFTAASDVGGEIVVVPLGTREVLVIRETGSEIAAHVDAPASADLVRVAERLPHAFAQLADAALRAAIAAVSSGEMPERSDIQLRYPSPPRGALGRGT